MTDDWDVQYSPGCETAFAANDPYVGQCFLDYKKDYKITRWGWTIGPLDPGTYDLKIYAGAAQCDTKKKGTHVGDLSFTFDGTKATAKYTVKDGYHWEETHFYIGAEPLPKNDKGDYTVAPGQYTQVNDPVHPPRRTLSRLKVWKPQLKGRSTLLPMQYPVVVPEDNCPLGGALRKTCAHASVQEAALSPPLSWL
jgi:hypothetical protein